MKYYRYIIYIFLLLSIACEETPIEPLGFSEPKLLWNSALTEPLQLVSTMDPVIGSTTVVFSPTPLRSRNSPLLGLDKNSGSRIWYWDQLHVNSRTILPFDPHYLYQDILAYSPKSPLYGIDINTGEIEWENAPFSTGRTYNSGFGETVLHMFGETQVGLNNNVHLILANIMNGQWKIGYTLEGDAKWRPDLTAFTGKILANGDTVLYMTGERYNLDQREGETFILGYNLTKQEVIFEQKGTESFGFLALDQDKLIASGHYVRCYDATKGALLWEKGIPNGTGPGGAVLIDGKVLVNDNNNFEPHLHLFDITTGNLIWKSESTDIDSRLVIHKGVIYGVGDSELKAINLDNGKLLWSIRSPDEKNNSDAFFADVVSIDPDTDRLYTANYINALCYQLE